MAPLPRDPSSTQGSIVQSNPSIYFYVHQQADGIQTTMAGSISIRRSIRWLPGEASEPTSTMVLTSPERRFVDLRILKDQDTTQGKLIRLQRAGSLVPSINGWQTPFPHHD
jgi:hypothetical protein